ncbi:MAG: FCD domain-containing protein, partial [Chitinophagaceae bacterium]|nr:FCD domain-containing protein [Chitinophagaceae bacterium]
AIRKVIQHYEAKGGVSAKTEVDKNMVLINHSKGFNLVDFKDKVGFTVAILTETHVHDVLITHAKLECLMFKESIETGDDEWEANIMGTLYKLTKLKPDKANTTAQIWANRNNEFHNALVAACNINGLLQVRSKYLQMKEWFATLANNHMEEVLIAASNHDHTKLADLAIARKGDEACNKLHIHMMAGADTLVQNLKANGYISKN